MRLSSRFKLEAPHLSPDKSLLTALQTGAFTQAPISWQEWQPCFRCFLHLGCAQLGGLERPPAMTYAVIGLRGGACSCTPLERTWRRTHQSLPRSAPWDENRRTLSVPLFVESFRAQRTNWNTDKYFDCENVYGIEGIVGAVGTCQCTISCISHYPDHFFHSSTTPSPNPRHSFVSNISYLPPQYVRTEQLVIVSCLNPLAF